MKKKTSAGAVALGGTLAALAVVIMMLGGIIPIGTYCCPVLASLLLIPVLEGCGVGLAWAWYGAVAALAALLCPDKEAAAAFVFFGYYPICKPYLDRLPGLPRRLCKGVLFNLSVVVMYALLIFALGMAALGEEFRQTGTWMLILLLVLGNVTFVLVDVLAGRLTLLYRAKKKKEGPGYPPEAKKSVDPKGPRFCCYRIPRITGSGRT